MEKPSEYNQFEGFINWENADIFKEVISITQPKSILEIGFYKGASAFFWLYLSNAKLLSIDSMRWEGCSIENIEKLIECFGDRFAFICEPSEKVRHKIWNEHFDLLYVDGGHTLELASNDMQLGIDMEIKYIFIDDFSHAVRTAFNNIVNEKYEIIGRYYRKTTNEYIPMILVKRRTMLLHDDLVLNKIEKWQRIFNGKPIEIPGFCAKLRRRVEDYIRDLLL